MYSREPDVAVRLYRKTTHSEETGRSLLSGVGEIAQIAGWIASDAGEHDQAARAYRLGVSTAREAGDWAYWGSPEELDVMDARVYTELRRPLRAVPLLREVLSRYDSTHTRDLALCLSWLAVALVDTNEPEEGAKTARRMLDLAAGFPSDRTARRGHVVLAKLEPYRDVPEVREILDTYAA
ncbi:hypothetical protein F9B16_36650 [Actinomadura montaniterrae]|uniref:Tetratricopeptide repeat protein n=1 Tax=Actinomadura montaniterrae TaxID=1803903 RepID=A0A6L3VQQ8_9ACTN|nr:hypothetical protein F9B16_36650 [Actinomadura montaniterrae]